MGGPINSLTNSAITVAQFLADVPELNTTSTTDPTKVQIPTSAIQYWLNIATALLNVERWGGSTSTTYYLGIEMFTAHNVILEALAQRDMDMAGIPGVATGMVAGKSAADVQINYNNAAVLELDASHYNFTVYGIRFIRLARMFGAGPIQVGIGCGPGPLNGPGWQGPWVFNIPNPEL